MQIICVDYRLWGLVKLKQTVKQVMPQAVIHGCRGPRRAMELTEEFANLWYV